MFSKCLFETENFHMYVRYIHSFIHALKLHSFHFMCQNKQHCGFQCIQQQLQNMHQIKTLSEVLCHNCLLQYIHLFAEMILQAHHVIYKGKPQHTINFFNPLPPLSFHFYNIKNNIQKDIFRINSASTCSKCFMCVGRRRRNTLILQVLDFIIRQG